MNLVFSDSHKLWSFDRSVCHTVAREQAVSRVLAGPHVKSKLLEMSWQAKGTSMHNNPPRCVLSFSVQFQKYSHLPHGRLFQPPTDPLGISIPEGSPLSPPEFSFFLYPHFRIPEFLRHFIDGKKLLAHTDTINSLYYSIIMTTHSLLCYLRFIHFLIWKKSLHFLQQYNLRYS